MPVAGSTPPRKRAPKKAAPKHTLPKPIIGADTAQARVDEEQAKRQLRREQHRRLPNPDSKAQIAKSAKTNQRLLAQAEARVKSVMADPVTHGARVIVRVDDLSASVFEREREYEAAARLRRRETDESPRLYALRNQRGTLIEYASWGEDGSREQHLGWTTDLMRVRLYQAHQAAPAMQAFREKDTNVPPSVIEMVPVDLLLLQTQMRNEEADLADQLSGLHEPKPVVKENEFSRRRGDEQPPQHWTGRSGFAQQS